MATILSFEETKKQNEACQQEFWQSYGANARRLFYKHGSEWVTQGMKDEAAIKLVKNGWNAEHERQMQLN
jgi:hypothetical protein